jgi:hypothetical protein
MKADRCPTEPFTTISMPFGRTGRLRSISFDVDLAGDHVLGDALAGIAMDDDVCLLVHAGAVVAHMPLDLDRDRHVDADGDRMLATRVEQAPIGFVGVGL